MIHDRRPRREKMSAHHLLRMASKQTIIVIIIEDAIKQKSCLTKKEVDEHNIGRSAGLGSS